MSIDFEADYVSRRKLARKIMQCVDRYAWSKEEGRLVLDRRGDVVFLTDVVKTIERKEGE